MNPDSREELGTRPQIELDEERARAALHRTSERRQEPSTLWLAAALVVVVLAIIALVAF
jgi:hypothetical protein